MADVVRQLFLLENTKIKERNLEVQRTLATRMRVVCPVNGDRSLQEQVYEVATVHAAKLLLAQLSKSDKAHNIEHAHDEACDVMIESGQKHTVTALTQCDCTHFVTTGLPCAHIFIARSEEGLTKFVPELVPQRWLKQQYVQSMHDLGSRSHTQTGNTVTCDATQPQRTKSAHEKFREASSVTDALASLLAAVGQNEYDEKLGKLKFLLDVWKDGDDISLDRVSAQCSSALEGNEAEEPVLQHNSPSSAAVDSEVADEVNPDSAVDIEAAHEVNASSAMCYAIGDLYWKNSVVMCRTM